MRGKVDFKGTKDGIILTIKGDLSFDWIQILVQRKLKLARHFFEGAHIIGSYGYLFTEEQEAIMSQLIQAQSGMKVLNLEPYDFMRESHQKPAIEKEVKELKPTQSIIKKPLTGQAEYSIWGEPIERAAEIESDESEMERVETLENKRVGNAEKESADTVLLVPQVEEGVVSALDTHHFTNSQVVDSDALDPPERIVADQEDMLSQVPLNVEAEAEAIEDEQAIESYAYGGVTHKEESTAFVSDTVFHRGTLRSGKRIDSRGNIVILGDVNPGAELKAKGNIIVMGSMRGMAHAGADGNADAFVAAIKLIPTQLRIHKIISRPPDEGHVDANYPEIAYVKEGKIIIEPYL